MTYSATEYNLTDLLQDAYRELGQLNVSTATGGSTTTVIDSKLADKAGGDDAWIDGAVFIIEDDGGAGAAPEGEFKLVTAYADATGTFTIGTLSSGAASGDVYGYANTMWPLYTMVELANDALRSLGDIPLIDTTSTDSAASQTEYTYAVAWTRKPPLKVEIQTKTSDANDNQWVELLRWEYRPATAGSTGLIVFDQLPVSRDIAIWYIDRHPRVNTYDDSVHKSIHPELAKRALVEKALQWQNRRMMGGDDFLMQSWNDAKMGLVAARAEHSIWKPKRRPKLLTIGGYIEEDQFTYPGPA